MTKFLLFFVFSMITIISHAQTPTADSSLRSPKEELLQKSKNQRTGGIVLLAVGGAAIIGTGVVATKDLENLFDDSNSNEGAVAALFVVGAASVAGGIISLVSGHRNKKRAMSMTFQNIPTNAVMRNMALQQYIPSISLRFRL